MTTTEEREPPACDTCGKRLDADAVIGTRGRIYCSRACALEAGEEVDA